MRCSQKKRYATLDYAKKVAAKMQDFHEIPFYAYRCKCGSCHVTKMSQSDYDQARNTKKKIQEKRIQNEAEYWIKKRGWS